MPRRAPRYTAADLESIPLFRFVPFECIEGILEHCTVQDLRPGDRYEPAEAADRSLCVLIAGRLALYYDAKMRDDEPPLYIERGEIVGETFVTGEPGVPCILVAAEPCRIMTMEEDLIWSLAQASHAAACNLLGILLRRRADAPRESFSGTVDEYAIHEQGIVDPLTGFQTRRWLEGILDRQVARSLASGKPLSLVIVDIDRFREFNEHHGRLGGDHALHEMAKALRNYLRPTELVARYGGDIFAILLPEANRTTALTIAERLRQRVANTVINIRDGKMLPALSISIGVADVQPGMGSRDLTAAARAALSRAKVAGGNTVAD
ncbi:diguanylate cyclase [Geotalea uraniireducens]|uniref:diguanylate cyclase n=1 Tax=Geotalea uraniireducens TaxID=351604 RepID=A0ABM8ENH0_9BACT|nr:diguanylate cyclase [Geotalea uraniireducens]BDV44009.1 diguanylate cyclase [Geotalea uraniireducens]